MGVSIISRAARRNARWVAILLVIAGWGVPVAFPHGAEDDLACAPLLAAENTSGVAGDDRTEVQPEHCLACHSARSFRSALNTAGWTALWLEPGLVVPERDAVPAPSHDDTRLPARAPPSTFHTI